VEVNTSHNYHNINSILTVGACKDTRGELFVLWYLHVLTLVRKPLARAP
jgi:hypothetical protein